MCTEYQPVCKSDKVISLNSRSCLYSSANFIKLGFKVFKVCLQMQKNALFGLKFVVWKLLLQSYQMLNFTVSPQRYGITSDIVSP